MVDAATETARRGRQCFFVAPRPKRPFLNAGGQPPVLDALALTDPDRRVIRGDVGVGTRFELGTLAYRASVLLSMLRRSVPRGTAVIPSDDAASWAAACAAAAEYSVVGVLHADDEHYYELARRHQHQVAGFVCVSSRIEGKLRQLLPTLRVPVRRIPCGITLGAAGRAKDAASSSVRLVWAGRIEERQKRVSDLARILEKLVTTRVDARLEILGDGPDRPGLETEFASRGVSGRVTWTGWLPGAGVREHLARADVFLLPSTFEGMPIAAMEALAEGCGVVGSQNSGLEELVQHPDAVSCLRTFRVGDVDGAVGAVRSILAINAASRVGAARALAAAEFSIQTCISRYEELEGWLDPPCGSIRTDPAWAGAAWIASFPIAAVRRARVWVSQFLPASRGARKEAA